MREINHNSSSLQLSLVYHLIGWSCVVDKLIAALVLKTMSSHIFFQQICYGPISSLRFIDKKMASKNKITLSQTWC